MPRLLTRGKLHVPGLVLKASPMCPARNQFSATAITTPEQLQNLQHHLDHAGIRPGVLAVKAGNLQWADFIECVLECNSCGQRFALSCETYHGAGGTFGPVDSES